MRAAPRHPQSTIRNPKSFPDHDRFAPLLLRVVVAGLLLGGVAFVRAAIGIVDDGTLLEAAVALAPAGVVVAFVVWHVLCSFRPWYGLALGLGCALGLVLVLESTMRWSTTAGVGVHALPFLRPQFMTVAYVILLAALLAAYLSHRLNHTYGLLGALFLVTAPPMLGPDRTGVWLSFYGTGALLCLFLWCETRKRVWLITGGLGLGFAACGDAWQLALFVVVLGLGALVFLSRRRHRWKATAGFGFVLVSCSVVPYGVWEAIAVSVGSGDEFAELIFGYARAAASSLPYSEDATVATLLAAIVHSVSTVPVGEVRLPSALIIGPATVCFLPWAFRGQWGYEKWGLSLVALVVVFVSGASGSLKSIGLMPIIPMLAMLATYGIYNLYMNVRRPALLFTAAVVLLAWNTLTTLWNDIV